MTPGSPITFTRATSSFDLSPMGSESQVRRARSDANRAASPDCPSPYQEGALVAGIAHRVARVDLTTKTRESPEWVVSAFERVLSAHPRVTIKRLSEDCTVIRESGVVLTAWTMTVAVVLFPIGLVALLPPIGTRVRVRVTPLMNGGTHVQASGRATREGDGRGQSESRGTQSAMRRPARRLPVQIPIGRRGGHPRRRCNSATASEPASTSHDSDAGYDGHRCRPGRKRSSVSGVALAI